MVYAVQQLVVRYNLRHASSLTDLHDGNAAWQGLGSAVLTSWARITTRLARSHRIATATLYLGGIAALHTTIPAVLSVEVLDLLQSTPLWTQTQATFGPRFTADLSV